MRTQQQFLSDYGESHRNSVNQLIHYICVPVIAFSTLALLWAVPIGRWLGLDAATAPWINIVTLSILPVSLFYLRMSYRSFAAMIVWYAISVALILLLQQSVGMTGLVAIAALLWIAAWALQFYGHKVEGAKPSFVEDLVFLLIGPLFLMDKLFRRIGLGGL